MRMSLALRAKGTQMKSTPISMPKRISSWSLGVSAGRFRGVPGRLIDLWLASMPVFCTVQRMSPSARASSTASSMRPSSMRIEVPGSTWRHSPLWDWVTRRSVPSTSRSVRVMWRPACRRIGSLPASRPVRMSGPLISIMMAVGACISRRTFFRRNMRARWAA